MHEVVSGEKFASGVSPSIILYVIIGCVWRYKDSDVMGESGFSGNFHETTTLPFVPSFASSSEITGRSANSRKAVNSCNRNTAIFFENKYFTFIDNIV